MSLSRLSCCLCCLLCLSTLACTSGPSQRSRPRPESVSEGMPIRRADPAYLQYLERQSMLASSVEMAKIVSGSQLAWRTSASLASPDEFLGHADTWLNLHPLTFLADPRRTAFDQLADGNIAAVLRETGIQGLYVAPVRGSGSLWAKDSHRLHTGEDVVQYNFSESAGKDQQYRRMMGALIQRNTLMGSDLIPAATGIGPDFFLAARNVREYPGIYCMVEIPQELWPALPAVSGEWSGAAVSAEGVAALNGKGLLPKSMRDDTAALGRKGGWAATAELRGMDGTTRRWVYRYYQDPAQPVLNWEDPSQAAHRILSGSTVQQVGMEGQAFIGLRFEAFQGLEAASGTASPRNAFSVEPALSAAQAMSREIRRYGGWSWVRDDDLPLPLINDFIRSGSDFIYDSAFSPAAEHALLTGDATLARFMADEILRLRVDSRRLVHAMPAQEGINYTLPHLNYLGSVAGEQAVLLRRHVIDGMRSVTASQRQTPFKDGILYSTAPGIAAMALGLDATDVPDTRASEVAKGHELLVLFRAMQPGVLLLAGQDLAGALPLGPAAMPQIDTQLTTYGAYPLTSTSASLATNRQGMAKTKSIYPPADAQVHMKDSFVGNIGKFIKQRTQLGIARGTLIARPATKGAGLVALLTRLPDGKGFVLSVCNFARTPVSESISLAGVPGVSAVAGKASAIGGEGKSSVSGTTVNVSLGPWQGRAILLGNAAASAPETPGDAVVSATGKEEAPHIPAVPAQAAPQNAPEPLRTHAGMGVPAPLALEQDTPPVQEQDTPPVQSRVLTSRSESSAASSPAPASPTGTAAGEEPPAAPMAYPVPGIRKTSPAPLHTAPEMSGGTISPAEDPPAPLQTAPEMLGNKISPTEHLPAPIPGTEDMPEEAFPAPAMASPAPKQDAVAPSAVRNGGRIIDPAATPPDLQDIRRKP